MSDQELDNLFKEASAKYEAPFDEKEWEKMVAMLDATSSPKPGFWNWKTISGLALLLFMSATVLLTQWDKISGGSEKGSQVSEKKMSSKDAQTLAKEIKAAPDEKKKEKRGVNNIIEIDDAGGNISEDSTNDSLQRTNSSFSLTHKSPQPVIPSQLKSSPSAVKKISGTDISEIKKAKAGAKHKKAVRKNPTEGSAEAGSKTAHNRVGKTDVSRNTTVHAVADGNVYEKEKDSRGKQTVSAVQQLKDDKTSIRVTKATADDEAKNPLITSDDQKGKAEMKAIANDRSVKSNESKPVSSLEGASPARRDSAVMLSQEHKQPLTEWTTGNNSPDKKETNIAGVSYNPFVKKTAQEKSSDSAAVKIPATDSLISNEALKKEEQKKMDSLTKLHRFSLKLALSPDFSSVGYFNPGKTGFNYGLLAEYAITRHWSVALGGIWSKKSYADTQTESSGYGTVNSTYINGSCRVLDLPLNITYYITPQNAFTLYGSVGLSSYFMFDEDYTYDYVYGTNQYSYSMKIDRGNTEWFRMMNLSVGIQQQLSSRVRLQMEPFIKAPLSGIGGGDLKLVSSGVFFNLKYTFK